MFHKMLGKGEGHFCIVSVAARRIGGVSEHCQLVAKTTSQPRRFLALKRGTDTVCDRFSKQATVDLFNSHASAPSRNSASSSCRSLLPIVRFCRPLPSIQEACAKMRWSCLRWAARRTMPRCHLSSGETASLLHQHGIAFPVERRRMRASTNAIRSATYRTRGRWFTPMSEIRRLRSSVRWGRPRRVSATAIAADVSPRTRPRGTMPAASASWEARDSRSRRRQRPGSDALPQGN
jgi:hypothetical protein